MVVNVDAPTEVKPPYFAPLGRRTGGVPEFLGFSLDFHSVNISGSGVGSGSVSVFLAMWTRSLGGPDKQAGQITRFRIL